MDIADQLRAALATANDNGRTGYAVAKAAGLKPEVLYRFARGTDLRLSSAARLATVLGLTLTPVDAGGGQPVPERKQAATRPKTKRK